MNKDKMNPALLLTYSEREEIAEILENRSDEIEYFRDECSARITNAVTMALIRERIRLRSLAKKITTLKEIENKP